MKGVVGSLSTDELRALQESESEDQLWLDAASIAVTDVKLKEQLSILHCLCQAVTCLAGVEASARSLLKPTEGQAPLMNDGVALIQKLRATMQQLHITRESENLKATIASFCDSVTGEAVGLHVNCLGEAMRAALESSAGGKPFSDVFMHICAQCEDMAALAGKVWSDQAEQIAASLDSCIPKGWALKKMNC